MKKAELKKLRPLKASAQMMRAYEADQPERKTVYGRVYGHREMRSEYVYKHYRFYQAQVESGILKVGIWQRCYLKERQQEPDFTIYISREENKWLTWGMGRWQTAMIFNLVYARQEGERFGHTSWSSRHSLKTVTEYLGIDAASVPAAVRKWQVSRPGKLPGMHHKSELEEIDEFMESVPEYPAGFNNDWLVKTAFADCASILYHPGRRVTEGLCIRCQTWVQIKERPGHLKETVCPHCKAKARFRSWKKQKRIQSEKHVGIIQRVKGGTDHCLSRFGVRICWEQEDGYRVPHIRQGRTERFRLAESFVWHETFERDEYKNTGITRWCHAKKHGMGYSYYYASPCCVLYEKNLPELLKDTPLRYIPVKNLLLSDPGRIVDAADMLQAMHNHPEMFEKLIKAGMNRLAYDLMERRYNVMDNIDPDAGRLADVLCVDAERMRLAVQMNCSRQELKMLQLTQKAAVHADEGLIRNLEEFYGHRSDDDILILLKRKNLKKMFGYLNKVRAESGGDGRIVARDYEDYLEQLERLGMPFDKHNRFPANFYHVHEELSGQIREMENKIQAADTRKKNRILKKIVRALEPKYAAESEKFLIVWPRSKKDFITEGQKQHNCVGGYFDRCVTGETVVLFVRRKDAPDQPYCTVEFKRGLLMQCRAQYNRDAPEDVMKYMEKISEHYMRMTEQQMTKEGA